MNRQYLLVLCCLISTTVLSLEQQVRSWSILDFSGALTNKWEYDLNTQARYNFTEHEYQSTLSEAGLGYKINSELSLWAG